MLIIFQRNITSLYGMRQRARFAAKNIRLDTLWQVYDDCQGQGPVIRPRLYSAISFSLCHEASKVRKRNFASKIAQVRQRSI